MARTPTQWLADAQHFLNFEVWHIDLSTLPRVQRLWYAFLRMVSIVGRLNVIDRCSLQSSALTFATLMSMVPILALMFAVAKGLGAYQKLQGWVGEKFTELPPNLADFKDSIFALVDKANFAAVGAIGCLLMFVTVIQVMGRAESSFNQIWGVRTPRTMMRRFADYISVLMVVPVLVLVASTLNASLSSGKFVGLLQDWVGPLYFVYAILLKLSGLFGIVAAFAFLYAFLPNTKVRASAAFVGGVVAGVAWLAWQWVCINVQIVLTRYNAVYGAFATIPISLFWLYINWYIIFFGAEISFAFQNFRTYTREGESDDSNFGTRRTLAFYLVYDICRRYHLGQGPWPATTFQERWQVPIRLLKTVLYALKTGGVLLEVGQDHYVPARDPATLSMKDVEVAMHGTRDDRVQLIGQRMRNPLTKLLEESQGAHLKLLGAQSFAELLQIQGGGFAPTSPIADTGTFPAPAVASAAAAATPGATTAAAPAAPATLSNNE